MNNHTFLFEPAEWIARGTYRDESNVESQAEGETAIIHSEDLWMIKSSMKISGEKPSEFTNQYEVTPFIPGFPSTAWISVNPDIGTLIGRFTVVRDSILSSFTTEDKKFSGVEFMLLRGDGSYHNEGVFYMGKRMMSCWAMTLTRKNT